jgi:hypothetical protein
MNIAKKKYPFQNVDLEDIKGERWEDIPGSGGYFMVSDFGRLKRLQYEMQYKNGAIYVKPEKIIKPTIIKSKNEFKNDYNYFLTNSFTLDGKKHSIMLSRMVYHCFVEPFNLDDKKIIILNKDHDGLNVVPENLIKATFSDRAARVVARGRMESSFKNLSKENKENQRAAIIKKVSKQVSQYSLQGKKIKTYSSVAAAARATGILAASIAPNASGKGLTAGGYVWRWGKEKIVDVESRKEKNKNLHRLKYGQKVTQYDFEGNKIACFPSLQDAEAATGAHPNAIRLILKGMYKSVKGYFWQKGYGKDKIDLSNYQWGKQSMAAKQSKKVKQFSLEGKLINTFPSITQAALSVNIPPSFIVGVCKGRQKTSAGYKWEYA